MSEPVRLSKRLAELIACSRREAELYIEGGWVLVDGEVVEEPQFKVLQQTAADERANPDTQTKNSRPGRNGTGAFIGWESGTDDRQCGRHDGRTADTEKRT